MLVMMVAVLLGASDAEQVLAEAQRWYDAHEYDRVIDPAEALLSRDDVSADDRMQGHLLLASALAIVGDPVKAEKQFRFLLRGRPDFDLDATTSPKILAIFRKVQSEENAFRDQIRELQRQKTIAELAIVGEVPGETTGGLTLDLSFRIRDPRGVVSGAGVHYRRGGENAYSMLPLQRDDGGMWRAQLPGEWSENEDGFDLEYFVATQDEQGETLINRGAAMAPLSLIVAPGTVPSAPVYEQWWFWPAVVVGAGLVGTSIGFAVDATTALPQGELPGAALQRR